MHVAACTCVLRQASDALRASPAAPLPPALVEAAAELALAHGPIGVKRLLQLAERAVAAEAFGRGEVGEGATASDGVADGAAVLDAVQRYADETFSVPFKDCDIKS